MPDETTTQPLSTEFTDATVYFETETDDGYYIIHSDDGIPIAKVEGWAEDAPEAAKGNLQLFCSAFNAFQRAGTLLDMNAVELAHRMECGALQYNMQILEDLYMHVKETLPEDDLLVVNAKKALGYWHGDAAGTSRYTEIEFNNSILKKHGHLLPPEAPETSV